MSEPYEIVPGKSIGPFKLGMTAEEIAQLPVRPQKPQAAGSPIPGVYVFYDDEGKCCRIQAIFAYKPTPPVFTLLGHVVNGMTDSKFRSLVGGRRTYAAVHSPAAGISAIKWERSDDHIMSIIVTPKRVR